MKHAAATDGRFIYVSGTGGFPVECDSETKMIYKNQKEVERFDPIANTWPSYDSDIENSDSK